MSADGAAVSGEHKRLRSIQAVAGLLEERGQAAVLVLDNVEQRLLHGEERFHHFPLTVELVESVSWGVCHFASLRAKNVPRPPWGSTRYSVESAR